MHNSSTEYLFEHMLCANHAPGAGDTSEKRQRCSCSCGSSTLGEGIPPSNEWTWRSLQLGVWARKMTEQVVEKASEQWWGGAQKEGPERPLWGGGACSERDGEASPSAQSCGWRNIQAVQGVCLLKSVASDGSLPIMPFLSECSYLFIVVKWEQMK